MNVALLNRLRGKAGDKKDFVFRDGTDKEITLPITFVKPAGVPAQFGNLPAFYVTYTARKIDKNIGYFHLSAFFDPPSVMQALEAAVREHQKSAGFIIDLRGNPGGIGAMALGFGGFFIDKSDQKLGTMSTRDGSLNFVLHPRSDPFMGPLAILVDSMSGSTAEILAGGLQDLKRARVCSAPNPWALPCPPSSCACPTAMPFNMLSLTTSPSAARRSKATASSRMSRSP